MTSLIKQFQRVAVLGVICVQAAACQTGGTNEINEPFWYCEAFRPITWVETDSAETLEQVIEHNSVWDALCGEAQPKLKLKNLH